MGIIQKVSFINVVWLSLVERFLREEEAAGSNPVTATQKLFKTDSVLDSFFYSRCQVLKGKDTVMVRIEMAGIVLNIFMGMFTAVIFIGILRMGSGVTRQMKVVYMALLFGNMMELLSEIGRNLVVLTYQDDLNSDNFWLLLSNCFLDLSYYTILFFFFVFVFLIVNQRHALSPVYVLIVLGLTFVGTVLWIVSEFENHIVLIYTEAGEIVRGPFYHLYQAPGYLVGFLCVYLMLRYRKFIDGQDFFWMSFSLAFPSVTAIMRNLVSPQINLMPAALSFSGFCVYNYIFLRQDRQVKEQRMKIREDQLLLMVSQIQPHFIFNMLNTIYVLCEQDPMKAQTAVGEFSDYLRANLDSFGSQKLISGAKELEHVSHYLKLEKIRFGDEILVKTDIQTQDFFLPALSIQPIVENAIKHGVFPKEGGGTVTITTEKIDGEGTRITIADDGVGFDVECLPHISDDGTSHVGLANVRKRLETMCNGSMEITSAVGVGTKVTILLPQEKGSVL